MYMSREFFKTYSVYFSRKRWDYRHNLRSPSCKVSCYFRPILSKLQNVHQILAEVPIIKFKENSPVEFQFAPCARTDRLHTLQSSVTFRNFLSRTRLKMYVVTNERVCHSTQDNIWKSRWQSTWAVSKGILRPTPIWPILNRDQNEKKLDNLNAGPHHTEFEKESCCFDIIL
jgi:hypothetical protein